jgi:uncharacterized membrane protein
VTLQHLVARVLRIGLVASLVLIATGVVIEETSSAGRARTTLSSGTFPHSLAAVFHGLARGSGRALVEAGLALLVCTPIAAVAAAVIAWRHQGDWKMAGVGAAVIAVLGLSCALAVIGA